MQEFQDHPQVQYFEVRIFYRRGKLDGAAGKSDPPEQPIDQLTHQSINPSIKQTAERCRRMGIQADA